MEEKTRVSEDEHSNRPAWQIKLVDRKFSVDGRFSNGGNDRASDARPTEQTRHDGSVWPGH
jgi:hypothetical protein